MATDAVEPDVPVLRIIAGFAIQPVVAGLIAYLLFPMVASVRGLSRPHASGAAVSVAAGAVIVALCTLVVAVPLFAWRVSRGRISFAETLAWGGALAVVPLLGLFAASGQATSHNVVRVFFPGVIFGLVSSALFWLIAIRRTVLDSDLRAS